jgi:flavin-dependent dehydrogenase
MTKDVAIVGASSAGLYTANLLAQKGLDVKVFEAKDSLNHSPRTLIVTSYLGTFGKSLMEGTVVNKIRRFELFADGRVATVSLKQPDLVIERSALIQRLAGEAKSSGAQIFTGNSFSGFKSNGRKLTCSFFRNGDKDLKEYSVHTLVGADGTFSKVAHKGGWPKQPVLPLLQAIVELPEDMPPDTTRVWFLPEDTPYFYWLIPHSPRYGVVGLIAEDAKRGQEALQHFLERKSLNPKGFQFAYTPLFTRWIPNHRKIGKNDVHLVGDAAGHVKVTTVGGVVTGLRGAKGVAEAILNGGNSTEFRSLRSELNFHLLIRKSLNGFGEADYVRLLDMLSPSIKRLLSLYDRDEASRLLLHLLFKKPSIILLGLKSLLVHKIPFSLATRGKLG